MRTPFRVSTYNEGLSVFVVCTRASSVHGAFSMPSKPCSVACNSDGKGHGQCNKSHCVATILMTINKSESATTISDTPCCHLLLVSTMVTIADRLSSGTETKCDCVASGDTVTWNVSSLLSRTPPEQIGTLMQAWSPALFPGGNVTLVEICLKSLPPVLIQILYTNLVVIIIDSNQYIHTNSLPLYFYGVRYYVQTIGAGNHVEVKC